MYHNITEFGAVGDGTSLNTSAIQKAIDTCAKSGGGVVNVPAGRFLTGSVALRDNITLNLDPGAVLVGSRNIEDYGTPDSTFLDSANITRGHSVIRATGASNIAITGRGTIDGRHGAPYAYEEPRPFLIRLCDCRDILVEDITLKDSPAWAQHYMNCEDLTVRGIKVHGYANRNNDGIDIDGCRRVIITGCRFDSRDDAITLKCTSESANRDIVVSDCVVTGNKSAVKFGTETNRGNFENISISNCVFYGSRGINLYTVDGAVVDNITISNISMRDAYAVILMRLGARMLYHGNFSKVDQDAEDFDFDPSVVGELKNIMISNIQATCTNTDGDFICGLPGHPIRNVVLDNICVSYAGGGTEEDAKRRDIPEKPKRYPKHGIFGTLPAYGLFIRHAQGVSLRNVRLDVREPDARAAVFCSDVDDLEVSGLSGSCAVLEATPKDLIRLENVRGFHQRDSQP